MGEWGNLIPLCWFCLNNSETIKAVILEFWSIQLHFIRDIHARFGIRYSSLSPDIGQNSDGGISDFRVSVQSFIKENCHNSRFNDDIDRKLGPVTKLDKRNKKTSKKDNDVVSENCDVTCNFSIYSQMHSL